MYQPPYFTKVLSACELRTEFTRHKCCKKNCCSVVFSMPIDRSLDWSTYFADTMDPLSLAAFSQSASQSTTEFENFMTVLRRATSSLRLNTPESDAKLTDYLKTRFAEKHKKFANNRIEWTYDLMHPLKGNVVVCRRAWIGCFRVTFQKVRFAQDCVKSRYIHPTRGIIYDQPVTLKGAFDRFGLDFEGYYRSFSNFMDISKVSETEVCQVAVTWLANEFDFIGEAQPDENVRLLDDVEKITVYDRYQDDDRIKSVCNKKLSYKEFTRVWNEVFPKVK